MCWKENQYQKATALRSSALRVVIFSLKFLQRQEMEATNMSGWDSEVRAVNKIIETNLC